MKIQTKRCIFVYEREESKHKKRAMRNPDTTIRTQWNNNPHTSNNSILQNRHACRISPKT